MEPQVCATCFWTIDRQLNVDEIKLINKKWHERQYQAVWQIAGKWSFTQCRSVHSPATINKINDLALNQEDKLLKQFAVEYCVTD